MRVKLLVIAAVLAGFVQGAGFGQTAEDAESYFDLGQEYYDQGDYAQAETYWIEAKDIVEKILGKEHPDYVEMLNCLGALYYSMGHYANAIEYFLEMKLLLEKTVGTGHPDYATSLNNLGVLYEETGDYGNAERYHLEAVAVRETVLGKEHPDYAISLNNLGLLYQHIGDYGNAERYYLESTAIRERVLGKEHPYYATALDNLGGLYSDMGDYGRAERYYLEAIAIREKVLGKEHPHYAVSLDSLGGLYYLTGDYDRAERYYLESTAIRETVLGKGHPDYAVSLTYLGVMYYKTGDYGRAENYFLGAIAIRETVLGKEHPDYALSLNNLGELYWSTGDYGRAERYYLEATAIRETVLGKEHPDYATSLDSLGGLYDSMGDYGRAENYFLEAIAIRETVLGKGHPDYAISLNNLGLLYTSMGDYGKAERYYLEATTIMETVLGKGHPDYAISLNNLGMLYDSVGDYDRAERYYLEAIATMETVLGKEHPDYAISLDNLGGVYRSIGDYGNAERYHLEAQAIWETVLGKEHPDYIISVNNLYMLYLSTNNYTQALAFKQEADRLNTGTINRNFSFLSEQQRTAYWSNNLYAFELSYSLSWHHPVSESNVLNYDNALFSKGLLLRTTNAVRDAIYSSGNQALIGQFEKLGQLRQQIGSLQQGGGNEARIQTLEAEAEVLDKSLTQTSSAFEEFKKDLNLNWQNVRDSLQPNEAAVEFVSFRIFDKNWTDKPQYAALVLRHGMNAPAWIPLCEESILTDLFKELDGEDSFMQAHILYDEKGQDLYNAVWRPLENMLKDVTTVYYSPSGLLHKVAFNAIPVNEDKRLMDVYDLNLVSSTREVVYLKTKTAGAPSSAVVYGGLEYNADADSMHEEALAYNVPETEIRTIAAVPANRRGGERGNWPRLDGTEEEQRVIQLVLTENRVTPVVYSGAGGNEESFKALDGKKTSVLHLATHGFFIEDIEKREGDRELLQRVGGGQKAFENPLLRSGLVLSGANHAWLNDPVAGVEDGLLLADEVARLNLLGAELVVLSACTTGLGEVNNSEGVFGLQRAFKLAGVETLVMSLWEVDDRATMMLMEHFYQNWLSGKSKQEAMKEAQRSLRSNEDYDYESPFYWAAFVLMD